jgi:hypothetical protein
MSAPKMFKRILITDSMNPIIHHVLFFKFLRDDEIVSMFYVCCPHVLCIVLMSIIHPYIGKHNVGEGNHGCARCNIHLVERFLRRNKINFYSFTTNLYATWHQKPLCASYHWFYVPNRPSCARIQTSNFEEDMVVSIWRCFYAVTKLIFIHPTTNFYSTLASKIFLRILTSDSMHPITHYVSWFKF